MSNNHNSKSNNFVYNINDVSDAKKNNDDDIDEYFCLLINMIDEIKSNDNTDFFDKKLSQYLDMMQNVIDSYYSLCTEKL